MRTLHFDIDGTVLALNAGVPKPALTAGRLEEAVRDARFNKLVCVGNFAGVIRTVWTMNSGYDGLGAIFALCGKVFSDEAWFRAVTRLVGDPRLRAAEVEMSHDWWYMDDEAEKYFMQVGRGQIFREHLGGRSLRPSPSGDGHDVLEWIRSIPRLRVS